MIKRIFFFLLAVTTFFAAGAQQEITDTIAENRTCIRISLLTCGPGYEEVYETFGHTAVRIVDSSIEGPLGDIVYNYGMFGYDDDFEMKFMRGKLLYYVATNLYGDFMEEYLEYGRSVEEQVLLLDDSAKLQINEFLKHNALPENRYYKYDFFFDNCATRIRDVFPRVLGPAFSYGKVLPDGQRITFRDIINRYFHIRHWERVGVNILLGSKIDKVMTDMDIMFLPDYLRDGLAGATVSGTKLATPAALLLPGFGDMPAGINLPMIVTCGVLVLTIAGLTIKRLRFLGRLMSALLLTISGLLGWLILTMWFATDHQGCADNFNILWALPLNLFIAFARPKGKGKYAIIAMMLIIVSLLLHVLHIQGTVPELVPLLLSLMMVHGAIYRQSNIKPL